jgi:hypothetical protein
MVNLKQMLQTSWFASEFLAGWHLTAKPSTLLARNQSRNENETSNRLAQDLAGA